MFDPLSPALALASWAQRAAPTKTRTTLRRSRTLHPVLTRASTDKFSPPANPSTPSPHLHPATLDPQRATHTCITAPLPCISRSFTRAALILLLTAKIAEAEALLVQLRDRKALARQASAARYGRRGSVSTVELGRERDRWEAIERGLEGRVGEMRGMMKVAMGQGGKA